jgi:coenzyme F420-0:L-glutamate ligase/coenzyme F420-1:gamma-L-glutamate ligase
LPEGEVETRVARGADRILHAPGVVVLCSTMAEMDHYADPRRDQAERTMALQSASLAGGNLLLAAHAEGLGACWMCGPLFAPQAVLDALDLPADWEPQALIVLGWPAERPEARMRRPFEETVRWR